MSFQDFEVMVGVYGVAMSLSPLLQVRRMLRERSSRDVSLAYLWVLLIGFGLYLAYGIGLNNWVLIATNISSVAATALTLWVALSLRGAAAKTVEVS